MVGRRVILGITAAVITALAIAAGTLLGTVNFPVVLLMLTLGPFAFIYLVLPAVAYPILVTRCPVSRHMLGRVLLVTCVPLAGSAFYLARTSEHSENLGGSNGITGLIVVALLFAILAGVAYLRESTAITLAYHGVLIIWFFAFAFPYLGEWP